MGSVFPYIDPFPSSWSNCKQLLKDLGLEYKKYMLVLMIAYYIGMKGKTKKYVINVVVHDGRIMKRNYQIRYYAISLSFQDYLGFTSRLR